MSRVISVSYRQQGMQDTCFIDFYFHLACGSIAARTSILRGPNVYYKYPVLFHLLAQVAQVLARPASPPSCYPHPSVSASIDPLEL